MGHAEAVLDRCPAARLVGVDRDQHALDLAGVRLAPFEGRTTLVHAVYDEIPDVLAELGIASVDGILFDLGVSSMQLDDRARGFSYASDAPLDMRMDQTRGITAAEVVNTYYVIAREKQQLRAVEEQMSISQTCVDLSQRKLEIGVGAKPDVLQSKVDLNAQKAAQLRQLSLIQQLKDVLNHLLFPVTTGEPPSILSNYDIVDSIPINFFITIDEIRAGADQSNPLLQIAQKNIEIADLTIEELKADRWPVVEFNSSYIFSGTKNNVAINPVLPVYNRNRGLNYGFTAFIPILNYRNTHRLIRQAELNKGFKQLLLESAARSAPWKWP